MAMRIDIKNGVKGGRTTRETARSFPRLHIFGASFNSAKAHLALRISSAWPGTDIRTLDIMGTNYQPAYARLNPNMTVPALEIDDQLLTDSDMIAEYLREKYPGKGDQAVASAARTPEMREFCELVNSWDEVMYTYGKNSGEKGGGMGKLMNKLREIRLRQNYQRLADPREKVWDGRALSRSYEDKIAYIANLSDRVDVEMTPEKREAFDRNGRVLDEIFSTADDLLSQNGQEQSGFLFGADFCTADVYFCPLLFRIEQVDAKELKQLLTKFPAVSGYYQRFCQSPEGKEAVTKFNRGWAMRYMRNQCIPCALFRVKWGCLKPAVLEPAAESRIGALRQG